MLERVEHVSLTQAWGVLHGAGYKWQYEDGFICTHPGGTLVGRALTAMYMPRRPDMRVLMEKVGEEAGCVGDQISWPIDMLVKDDVYIADVYGKHEQGPIVGDNLSTAIYAKSGKGIVHDASVRDIDGIREIEGFASFVRGFHPTYASPTIMLLGINCPVRIGKVTVMPGDVVLGKDKGELGRRRLHPAAPGREGGQDLGAHPAARRVRQAAAPRGCLHPGRDRSPVDGQHRGRLLRLAGGPYG